MTHTLSGAAELVGVPQPTATRWVKAGLIRPEGYVGRQGVPVRFDEKELRELQMLSSLRGAGMSFQALRRAAERLRVWGDNPLNTHLAAFAVIVGPSRCRELTQIVTPTEATLVTGKPGQLVFIPLWAIVADDTGGGKC
jgi:DNA-binding transcriptional MerR regulator